MKDATHGQAQGELTARGVTRPIMLGVTFDRAPRPGETLALTGTTTIDRRDFGMTAYSFIVARKVDITIMARMVPA